MNAAQSITKRDPNTEHTNAGLQYSFGDFSPKQDGTAPEITAETGWAQARRLALELECLLLSCSDHAAVSKWWDSAHEALEMFRVTHCLFFQQIQDSPRDND